MHIYNKIHVLLTIFCYMFRRLLLHFQEPLYRMLKTTVTLTDNRSEALLYMGLQLYLQFCK